MIDNEENLVKEKIGTDFPNRVLPMPKQVKVNRQLISFVNKRGSETKK
jgi:hypothetical protein